MSVRRGPGDEHAGDETSDAGRRDGGFSAAEFAMAAGVLLLPMALLVVSLPTWFQAHAMARAAVAEAAREVAVSGTEPATIARAQAAAARIDAGAPGRLLGPVRLVDVDGELGLVEASVTVELPAMVVPFVGEFGAVSLDVSHREAIDPFRERP